MAYRVHRLNVRLESDQSRLEQFLDGLEGDVVSVVPNVVTRAFWLTRVDFVLVIEKTV
jgi:hypothetical protein